MSIAGDVNAAQFAYQAIKERILDLSYGAGERLSETRIAAELGLGRSPVRTALARLKSEGWIAVTPQSGTYVLSPSEKDIEEVAELRVLLEMHVSRLAALKIPDSELARLRRAFNKLRRDEEYLEEFLAFDAMVHAAIYRAADNGLIESILTNLKDKVQWIRRTNAVTGSRLKLSYDEMQAVLEALEARDPELVAARMATHIRNAADFRKSEERDALARDRRKQAS
jgi:DNA-binding GntR family transcriptional regulator